MIARDSEARLRTDVTASRGMSVAFIRDGQAGVLLSIDLARKTYTALKLGDEPTVAASMEIPPGAIRKQFEGTECYLISMPGFVDEAWVSVELGHLVFERWHSNRSRSSWRMFKIQAGEPDPKLFQAPPGFRRL